MMSGDTALLILAILIPALLAPLSYLCGRKLGRHTGWVVSAGLAVVFTYLSTLAPTVMEEALEEEYIWGKALHLTFVLRADGLSLLLAMLVNFLCALVSVYSVAYMKHRKSHDTYFFLLTLFTAGMTGVVFSANLVQFFFFWELMVIPSFFLIAQWGYGKAWDAAFRYFLFSQVGAVFLLAGIAMTYASTGTLNLFEVAHFKERVEPGIWQLISATLIFGFAVKMALWPVQGWLPPAHADAPTPISVLLSGIMIKMGAYGVIRVVQIFLHEVTALAFTILVILSLVTMVYGGIMALIETDLKRLFAYSSISHMGYIFFGLAYAIEPGLGFSAAVLHIVNHAFSKALLFMCAGTLIHVLETRDIRSMGGLYRKMPITFSVSLVGVLGIIGLPPTLGFWSKDMLLATALETHSVPLIIAMVGVSILAVAYSVRWLYLVFLGSGREHGSHADIREAPLTMTAPILVLALTALSSLLYVEPLGHFIGIEHVEVEVVPLTISVTALLIGAVPTYWVYRRGVVSPSKVRESGGVKVLYGLLQAFSLERVYHVVFIQLPLTLSNRLFISLETGIIDRLNYVIARFMLSTGAVIRKLQTGVLSYNMLAILIAFSALLVFLLTAL